MEPATLYLTCLVATFGLWLVGERVWAFTSWLTTRSWLGQPARKISAFGCGIVIATTLWRAVPAQADVVPIRERTMAVTETATTRPVLTRYNMTTASHETVQARTGQPTYTVVRGDCLWKIARRTLIGDGAEPTGASIGSFWREIYAANRDTIGKNPNLIFPGQILVIPER
jgi:nucleoid-associated protein YgaU